MIVDLCRKLLLPWRGGNLFVGFSGGADSTAALLLTRELRDELGFHLIAVHFDHHLRGAESDAEARTAEQFSARTGVDFLKIDLDVTPLPGEGVEAAARRLRLDHWRRLVSGLPHAAVVLGHHAGDAAENLLIRIFRGSNASALAGMSPRSELDGVTILRPLLDFSRAEIEAFLRSRGVNHWQSDSSNGDAKYLRNYLRLEVLPEVYRRFPGGKEGICKTLENLRLDADFLDAAAAEHLSAGDPETCIFWRELPPALFARCMRLHLRGSSGAPFSGGEIDAFRKLAAHTGSEPEKLLFSDDLRLLAQHGKILFDDDTPREKRWLWRTEPEIVWGRWRITREFVEAFRTPGPDEALFDDALLPETLEVGAPRPGETMIPFGRTAPEKLRKLRIDRAIPARPPHPVLRSPSGETLWFAGIRHSAAAPVSPRTPEIILFSLRPAD